MKRNCPNDDSETRTTQRRRESLDPFHLWATALFRLPFLLSQIARVADSCADWSERTDDNASVMGGIPWGDAVVKNVPPKAGPDILHIRTA